MSAIFDVNLKFKWVLREVHLLAVLIFQLRIAVAILNNVTEKVKYHYKLIYFFSFLLLFVM
jgi:hypothetical protein